MFTLPIDGRQFLDPQDAYKHFLTIQKQFAGQSFFWIQEINDGIFQDRPSVEVMEELEATVKQNKQLPAPAPEGGQTTSEWTQKTWDYSHLVKPVQKIRESVPQHGVFESSQPRKS